MTPQQISQLYMANICLDGLWLIPSPTVADGLLQAFDGEEVKDLPPEIRDLIVSAQWSEDEIEDLFAGEGSSATEAWEQIAQLLPQFVFAKVSTPVQSYYAEGSASYSWGHTHVATLGARDFDTLMKRVLAWAEEADERDKARAAEKLKAKA